MKESQRSDGRDTCRRLLEAAAATFADRGFHETTVADICRRAGTNIAAVNYHFGGKEALYAKAWRHCFEASVAKHPPDGGVAAGAPAEARLQGQILALVRRIMDPDSLDVDILHKEMATPTGLLETVVMRSIERFREQFDRVVRELLGVDASVVDVQLCQMSIMAQCFGPLLRERERRRHGRRSGGSDTVLDRVTLGELAEHIHRFSLAGIRERKKRGGPRRRAPTKGTK